MRFNSRSVGVGAHIMSSSTPPGEFVKLARDNSSSVLLTAA